MMSPLKSVRPILAACATIGIVSATIRCASPTLVEVQIFADRVCALYPNATLQVSSGAVELLASPNVINASDAKLCSGRVQIEGVTQPVHTAYVQPSDLKDARFGFRSVVSPSGDLEGCSFENRFEGCIVSRRIFRFVPGDTTRLRIELHPECISKDAECAAFGYGTCVSGGRCGAAEVRNDADCSGPGCGEESLAGASSDAGATDAASDVIPDAMPAIDASTTSSLRGFSTLAAGRSSTCAVQSGKLYCWGKFIDVGGRVFGRLSKGSATAEPTARAPSIFAAFDEPNTQVLGVQVPLTSEYLGDIDDGSQRPIASLLERPCVLIRRLGEDQIHCDLAPNSTLIGERAVSLQAPHKAALYAFGLQPTTHSLGAASIIYPLVPTLLGVQASGDMRRSYVDFAGAAVTSLVHPTTAAPATRVVRVRSAFGHTCISTVNNRIYCDEYSQTDMAPWFSPPTRLVAGTPYFDLTSDLVGAGDEVLDIAPGDANICVLLKNQSRAYIICAGRSDKGATFGNTTAASIGSRDVTGLNIVSIHLGGGHACALSSEGKLRCWGFGGNGELGRTLPTGPDYSLVPIEVSIDNIVEVALGSAHTCARRRNDQIFCWGQNFDGTATGSMGGSSEPTRVLQ